MTVPFLGRVAFYLYWTRDRLKFGISEITLDGAPKSALFYAGPSHSGGVRDRHSAGWDAVDARQRKTSAAVAYGEIVRARRPGAGVKSEAGESLRGRWWQKSRSPGRPCISRKAIAQGRPEASAKPVCSWAAFFVASSLRDRGCGAHPVFPASSDPGGARFPAKLRAPRAARIRSRVFRHCPMKDRRGRRQLQELPSREWGRWQELPIEAGGNERLTI